MRLLRLSEQLRCRASSVARSQPMLRFVSVSTPTCLTHSLALRFAPPWLAQLLSKRTRRARLGFSSPCKVRRPTLQGSQGLDGLGEAVRPTRPLRVPGSKGPHAALLSLL